MSRLSTTVQTLLNKFADSQIALRILGLPAYQSNPKLGDLLASAMGSVATDESTYTVTATTGAVGAQMLSLTLPKGAIVRQITTDPQAALTSGGSATLAISAGPDALLAATAYSSSDFSAATNLLAAPVKLATGGALTVTVATAALTAGSVRLIVDYAVPAGTQTV